MVFTTGINLPTSAYAAANGLLTYGTGTGQINPTSGKTPATLAATDVTGNVSTDIQTIKTQAVTCAAGVTVLANVGTDQPINFTGTSTSALAKVDIIDWKSQAVANPNTNGYPIVDLHVGTGTGEISLSSGSVTVGTNSDKTGYALTQAFPTNFSDLAIDVSGLVALTSSEHTQIASDILDATSASYNTGGTIGFKINSAASAGDPWSTDLPDSYAPGSAGYLLGNLGSAADPWNTTLPGSYTSGKAGYIIGNMLDAAVSTRSTYSGGAVASVTSPVTVGTNSDKTGYSLSQSFPTNFSSLSIDSSGRVDLGYIKGSSSTGAAGYVGIDWAHVSNPTTTVDLSGTTVSTLTNLPSIPSNWITAAGINASALNGKGDWPIGKTGYALTSTEHSNIAADILDAAASSHNSSGTIGELINTAGDPWSVSLPGSYTGSQAGYLIGTYLDATISSRSTVTTILNASATAFNTPGTIGEKINQSNDPWGYSLPSGYDPGTAGYILGTNLDATVSSRSTFSGNAIQRVVLPVTVGTNNDKEGYVLKQVFPDNFSLLAVDTSGRVTIGTNTDKTGYSLTQTFPTHFSILSIDTSGKVTTV